MIGHISDYFKIRNHAHVYLTHPVTTQINITFKTHTEHYILNKYLNNNTYNRNIEERILSFQNLKRFFVIPKNNFKCLLI